METDEAKSEQTNSIKLRNSSEKLLSGLMKCTFSAVKISPWSPTKSSVISFG